MAYGSGWVLVSNIRNQFPRQSENRNTAHNEKAGYCKVEHTSSWINNHPSSYLNFILAYPFNFNTENLFDLHEGR